MSALSFLDWGVLYIEQKLDRVLKDKQVLDRQRQDKLISTISQTLTSAVHVKLEKVVKSEMKGQVTPGIYITMEFVHVVC